MEREGERGEERIVERMGMVITMIITHSIQNLSNFFFAHDCRW
jgi:hypothetical protein